MKSLRKNDRALMFNLLVGAGLAIILFFAIMNIGTYINSTIAQSLVDSLDVTTKFGNISRSSLLNISNAYDDTLDALTVAAIVMAITLPLAAVVAIRKFF